MRRLAAWLDLPCDDAALARVCEVSSFAFMSSAEHAHHFDDHFVRRHVLPKMGLPSDDKARRLRLHLPRVLSP